MTIDQLIALSTGIGACLSAVATFWTVRQIAKQREASYRPQLVFARTTFHASVESKDEPSIPMEWAAGLVKPKDAHRHALFSIPLRNVGLGAAKDVTISWSFPTEQAIERLNKTAQQALIPAYFKLDDLGVILESDTLGSGMWLWGKNRTSLDFVLPASVEQKPLNVILPLPYLLLWSAEAFFSFKSKDKKQADLLNFSRLSAAMEYTDIGDRTHRRSVELEMQIVTIGENGFNGMIDTVQRI